MPVNKVIYGDEVLIDLTADTVTAASLLKGVTAHRADGSTIIGVMTAKMDDDPDYVLANGFKSGTKTYSNNGRTITCISSSGDKLIKTFSEDLLTCESILSNQNGETIASSTTVISKDGLVVITNYNDGRVFERVFDVNLTRMTATLKSDEEVLSTLDVDLEFKP